MLQLVNLSNYVSDNKMIDYKVANLRAFLNCHCLDGIEMMFCAPWDKCVHQKEWIHGVHLRFWPFWLDFWRGNQEELLRQLDTEEKVRELYGGTTREAWLNLYRENIRTAAQTEAKYFVFHVSHARPQEVFNWQFSATNREVIKATVEVINELVSAIPDDVTLLFENLWLPGLTLKDRELTAMLLAGVKHPNVGIMLDTGHLMNTNPKLKTEEQGIDYIMDKVIQLGEYSRYIRGIHLHCSLSGEYIMKSKSVTRHGCKPVDVMCHVLKIDEHLPFNTPGVQQIVAYIHPDYLVHEFVPASLDDWGQKVLQQQQALGLRGAG